VTAYLKAFLIAGVIIPLVLHLIAPGSMPWWPDTASTGIGFGVFAVVMVARARRDRDMNRRLGNVLRAFGGHRPR
jgi:hypothetical protein